MDEQKIVLTLDPNQETQAQAKTTVTEEKTEEVKEVNLDNIDTSMLSQEDLATVDEFAKKIDITDGTAIMSYVLQVKVKFLNSQVLP